ncbi:cysteine--tRNA ligase [Rhizobium sp. TH2]|uniref:cysteine--tRNA ligase n=1 Tax=Rhizobium sp. TH2 TaxID=2775403 RepID=UPI002158968E|nr:cysteine--tRNA ligase [Rhizobium sp. TH2]UVC10588.1 cysteine--tRNA ligase [Rhizobium sp. TH2]
MGATPELRFYNTLTREKSAFTPIDAKDVRMYVCGPTVYDFAHIGNARPAIVFDVLFRLLRHVYGADHVTYARNITDVDDKINARALRDYPGMELNAAIRLVTEKTYDQYQKDVKALGCLEPSAQPRATEHIGKMVEINQRLIDRGHAYVATGAEGREVLFSTGSMADYGQLSKRKLEDQQAGARVAVEAHKKNPADFVLWKESAGDQPGWPAEHVVDGEKIAIHGRPGWHIECSAMSEVHLGEVFDIHGGGLDLIFPHHENEIAQSRCAYGHDVMANVWMHNGFLQVEGRKMSKSEGNFVTIHELLETETFGGRKWPGEVLRLAMLMTHYREPIDFTVDKLLEARRTLAKFSRWSNLDDQVGYGPEYDHIAPHPDVVAALSDDLNVPAAIKSLHEQHSYLSDRANQGTMKHEERWSQYRQSLRLLGFKAEADKVEAAVADGLDAIIQTRLEMLNAKNFAEADKIRDDLLTKGIQLKDGKDPATGERVTTWEVKR